jgi:uncharacterized protein YeaO (DUF488 family)
MPVLYSMTPGFGKSCPIREPRIIEYMTNSPIQIRRAYETQADGDGVRYLVDRFWPRGIKREALGIADWVKAAAPSAELCKWFGHDPALWEEFKQRYFRELDQHPEGWLPLLEAARREKVTLLFGARETQHNNAVALKEFLDHQLSKPTTP